MLRLRKSLPAVALFALVAWGNAQAMACCLLPAAQAAPAAETVVAEAMTDHSCCPRPESEGAPSSEETRSAPAMPGCGMDAQGMARPCCESSTAPAAVSAASSSTTDAPAGIVALTEIPFAAVPAQRTPVAFVASSPPGLAPSYRSLQRLLI